MADTPFDSENKPHDMGGRKAGPICPDYGTEPVFKQDWHARALAITIAAGGLGAWNLDASRHARESLPAQDYDSFSYYEKWLAALTNLLVEKQLITRQEIKNRSADKQAEELDQRAITAARMQNALIKGGPTERPLNKQLAFKTGDKVTTLYGDQINVDGRTHTRLPAYASGKTGIIIACHRGHVFPDHHAHFLGESPEPLYTVLFQAKILWPDSPSPEDEVCLDLFEPYLQPTKG